MQVSKVKYFSQLDRPGAYHLVRMAKGEEWKTAFNCRFGPFQYQVMTFGLTNTPAFFQHPVDGNLRDHLDIFCTAFIVDILVYWETVEEQQAHVRKILLSLQNVVLSLELEKCDFHVRSTKYLGIIISAEGIVLDHLKVSTVQKWPSLKTVK